MSVSQRRGCTRYLRTVFVRPPRNIGHPNRLYSSTAWRVCSLTSNLTGRAVFLLPHRRARCVSACGDILDPHGDDITAAKHDCCVSGSELLISADQLRDLKNAASRLGWQICIFQASTEREIDDAFADMAQQPPDALTVSVSRSSAQLNQIVGLVARYSVPTMYPIRQFPAAGGFMSDGDIKRCVSSSRRLHQPYPEG
jgi:hypothetical protein